MNDTNKKSLEERRVPFTVFKTRVRDESIGGENPYRWQNVTTHDIFKSKNIVFFALPGAFTPVCTTSHLPQYEALYDEFKKLGVDDVVCLSVNDAFVMNQWGKHLGIQKIRLIPDGSGDFTRMMGMLVHKDNLGFGMRSWRYSMYVEDEVIKKMFVEPGFSDDCPDDPYEVSGPNTILEYFRVTVPSTEAIG